MIFPNAFYHFVFSATVVSAFNLYHPTVNSPLKTAKAQGLDVSVGDIESEWKPLKPVAARNAEPFRPVGGQLGVDIDPSSWQPVNVHPRSLTIKRVPQRVCLL